MAAKAAIAALTAGGDLRTWSLIVTIFGDMARAPGAEIPGPVLSALTARIGVRPEAMRVALHRLRKDGWIASRREGRVSHYFLTAAGRAESEQATARIFARHPTAPETWHVAIAGPLDPGARLALDGAMAGFVPLAPGAWLGPGPAPHDLDPRLFTLDGGAVRLPAWLSGTLMPRDLAEAYERFDAILARVTALLADQTDGLGPLDRAALRILLVHGWRRLVLRHPDLPDSFYPTDWPARQARGRVHTLLDQLGEPSISELADAMPV